MYGADGVDIRSVNPMGTSSIIDLGYFMTPENFSQSMIDKYNNWKETFEAYQRPYFNLTVEEALKISIDDFVLSRSKEAFKACFSIDFKHLIIQIIYLCLNRCKLLFFP